jgi:hypothetical protein
VWLLWAACVTLPCSLCSQPLFGRALCSATVYRGHPRCPDRCMQADSVATACLQHLHGVDGMRQKAAASSGVMGHGHGCCGRQRACRADSFTGLLAWRTQRMQLTQLLFHLPVSREVCVLAPYPFTSETLDLGGPMKVDNGVLTLTMSGRDGARVQSKDVMKYGLFEITLQAAPGAGAVSTFYVSACGFCRRASVLDMGLPAVRLLCMLASAGAGEVGVAGDGAAARSWTLRPPTAGVAATTVPLVQLIVLAST